MLILIAAFRINMDFMKCIVACVLVGLTGDNAIQYLFAARGRPLEVGIKSRGEASIQTNLFMAITSLMYLFSYFNPPKTFGLLLAAGFVIALVGDLWILNGLLPVRPLPKRTGRAS
jgi:predicted RND superfamily exporter protein